jgi:hypothetical protein
MDESTTSLHEQPWNWFSTRQAAELWAIATFGKELAGVTFHLCAGHVAVQHMAIQHTEAAKEIQ